MPKASTIQIELRSADLAKDHPCADAHRIRILQAIDDLLVTNADDIDDVLKQSSKLARTVGVAIKYDISSGFPEVGVRITVTRESKKDSRRLAAEDPEQLKIPFERKAAEPDPEPKPEEKPTAEPAAKKKKSAKKDK
jgi:hypothetical protein